MSTALSPASTVPIGVGFDTARYGHHVTFLREDLQPACPPCEFPESRQGYDQLLRKFQQVQQRCATAHFQHPHRCGWPIRYQPGDFPA